MSTYESLLQQKAELDAQIAETRNIQRSQAIAVARTLILKYGLTFDDVFGKKRHKKARILYRPKYYDPVTGGSWSGQGKEPSWIKGKDRSAFLI
ncbi:H-NS histone family protein [Comamonas terrigena]|uniref:H-NS histone family protein n=1 Tax=Comamonas terrigena TaxID=32013 RepID=UPI002355B78A|nr:H-NS histone family protein [Comamonas terrigena]